MNYRIERLRYQLREDPSSRVFLRLAELLRAHGTNGALSKPVAGSLW